MSQFNIRSLREIHGDEQGKFLNTLAKRVSTFLNKEQTDKLENKEDIYSAGQDVESVVKFHDLVSTKYFDLTTEYYAPAEPDGDKVKLWIKGDNLGNDINDISGFDNHGTINGDPLLIDGTPFDYGIHTGGVKSVALKFNRPTSELVNQEYISIPDHTSLQISGIATGMSYFIRFRIHSIATQGGEERTLFAKVDDSTGDNGVVVRVNSVGGLMFYIKRAGVLYKKETAAATIATNTVYEVFLTYAVSGNVQHVYVNNVDKSLTTPTPDEEFHADLTNHDLSIFTRGGTSNNGYVYGDLYDFMVLREKVVTFNSIGNSVFFDGTNDLIQCDNHADLWSQSLTKFSYSFWIYPTAGWDTFNRQMVEKSGGSAHGFRCEIDDSTTGQVKAHIKDSLNVTKQSLNNNLILNQWNFITFVYDSTLGSANVKVYVNGIAPSTTADLTEAINQSATLTLSNSSNDFQGYMRDFSWWTTTALTSTEITDVMNNSTSAPTPDYHLRLTEGSGTPTDIIGYKTATLSNGASWFTNEVGNHYTNKYTTINIPFGQVMVVNYWALPFTFESSYTSDSYTSDSFIL